MDKHETRRVRLRELIDRRYNGKQANLAAAIGRQPDYVSRCLYPAGKKWKKNIGEEIAREIEKLTGLEEGWLDKTQDAGNNAPIKSFKEAITDEEALDPYAMLDAVLNRLVIVGSPREKIVSMIKLAAAASNQVREIIMGKALRKGG